MKKYLGEFYVFISAILWGSISIFVYPLKDYGFSSMQMVCGRAVITVIVLGVFLLIKDKSLFKINVKDIPIFIGSGILSFVFFNFCYMNSMGENSISVACLLMYTSPIWVTILSRIIFKEDLNIFKIIALVGALGGCSMVVLSNDIKMTLVGLLYGLGSGFGYALYSIFGKIASKKYKSETTSFYTFLFATIISVPLSKAWEIPAIVSADYISILYLIGIAVFCTILPYILYTSGLQKIQAGKASLISILEPVVASFVGFIVYGQKIGILGIIGIVIVVASLVFLEVKGNKKQAKKENEQ